jgi:hypothetical protein
VDYMEDSEPLSLRRRTCDEFRILHLDAMTPDVVVLWVVRAPRVVTCDPLVSWCASLAPFLSSPFVLLASNGMFPLSPAVVMSSH